MNGKNRSKERTFLENTLKSMGSGSHILEMRVDPRQYDYCLVAHLKPLSVISADQLVSRLSAEITINNGAYHLQKQNMKYGYMTKIYWPIELKKNIVDGEKR